MIYVFYQRIKVSKKGLEQKDWMVWPEFNVVFQFVLDYVVWLHPNPAVISKNTDTIY